MMKCLALTGFALILCFSVVSCVSPSHVPNEIPDEFDLAIVFPQATTEIAGGQSFRITAILEDQDGEAIEGALVEAELWTPDGVSFGKLPFDDKKSGRYLTEYVTLPLRNSQGLWQITSLAVLDDGGSAEAQGEFMGQVSYSERLQGYFGFWIDLTDLFSYNVPNAEDPMLKAYSYEDGGYVILANNLTTSQINNAIVILDVHWRNTDFPGDDLSVASFVLDLAGPHRISLDISRSDLVVEKEIFAGAPAWRVKGWWNPENALGDPRPDSPLDWMIFQCPGSETVWTVLITSNEMGYMDDLELIRESFECPPSPQ